MIANFAAMDIRPGLDGPAAAGHRGGDRCARDDDGDAVVRDGAAGRGRPSRTTRASSRCGPAGRRCSAATSHEEERYRAVLRRRLVPHRRPRPARRRRLLLVRRPRRRRHQVRRPPDRPVRGRERADGAPGGRRGRRDRQARPGRRRGRQGVRVAAARATSRARRCAASCSAFAPQAARRRRSRRRRSTFADDAAARPAAARSCAACSRRASSGLPEGDLSTLEADAVTDRPRRPRSTASTACDLLREMLRIRRFEETCVELYSAAKIRGFLHLYIGEEAVAVGVMQALEPRRRDRRDLPRARPRARARRAGAARSWPRCSASVEGCSRGRGGSMHLFDAATPLLRRQRDRRRRAAARGRAGARRQACRAARASPPASSATARSPRASSTSRMNLAALWQLPVLFCCENNLYAMGTALERSESRDRPGAQGGELRDAGLGGRRHGRRSPSRTPRGARSTAVRGGGGPALPGAAHLPLPRALDVRPRPVPRQGRRSSAGSERDPIDALAARLRAGGLLDDDDWRALEAEVDGGDRRGGRVRRGRHARSRSRTSTRFVYSEEPAP